MCHSRFEWLGTGHYLSTGRGKVEGGGGLEDFGSGTIKFA